eukprot:Nk52_evm11s1916 gene=Nk52_evmTU11s1916
MRDNVLITKNLLVYTCAAFTTTIVCSSTVSTFGAGRSLRDTEHENFRLNVDLIRRSDLSIQVFVAPQSTMVRPMKEFKPECLKLIEQEIKGGTKQKDLPKKIREAGLGNVSKRTIERWMKDCLPDLRARTYVSEFGEQRVKDFLRPLLGTPDVRHGYRIIKDILLQDFGQKVPDDTVRKLWKELSVDGGGHRIVRAPRKREYRCSGLNQNWHIDGHDKLQAYGIYIHGAIDGFSRYVLWLEADCTNRVPHELVKYYLKAVMNNRIVPERTVFDCGGENVVIADTQDFLCRLSDNPRHPFTFTSSKNNIPIERFWREIVNKVVVWWEDHVFKPLEDENIVDCENVNDYLLIMYLLLPLVREHLGRYMEIHNRKKLQRKKGKGSYVPSKVYLGQDEREDYKEKRPCGVQVSQERMEFLKQMYVPDERSFSVPQRFQTWVQDCLREQGISTITFSNCRRVYSKVHRRMVRQNVNFVDDLSVHLREAFDANNRPKVWYRAS